MRVAWVCAAAVAAALDPNVLEAFRSGDADHDARLDPDEFEAALETSVATALEASWSRSPPKAAAAVKDALARRPARRDSGASRVGVVKGLERAARGAEARETTRDIERKQ